MRKKHLDHEKLSAARLQTIVMSVETELRGKLFLDAADLLRQNGQNYTAKLFDLIGNIYNGEEAKWWNINTEQPEGFSRMAYGRKTGGRQKGSPNKLTATLKDMVLQALDESGGVEYLKQTAIDNPSAFLTLVGKVMPLQVTGENGGPVTMTVTWHQ